MIMARQAGSVFDFVPERGRGRPGEEREEEVRGGRAMHFERER